MGIRSSSVTPVRKCEAQWIAIVYTCTCVSAGNLNMKVYGDVGDGSLLKLAWSGEQSLPSLTQRTKVIAVYSVNAEYISNNLPQSCITLNGKLFP